MLYILVKNKFSMHKLFYYPDIQLAMQAIFE